MARTKRSPTHAELVTIAPVVSAVVPYQSNRQVVVYNGGNKSPALQVKPLRMKTKPRSGRGPQCVEKILPRRRYRPGTVALREIRRYQKTTNLLIPKLPFLV